ncbi:MAG: carboxypeptidase-like regulatory protein [Sediminibacterium sp.]|nr:carboxypeptidase-like regulatory protein [Sediminibacterium sp.]
MRTAIFILLILCGVQAQAQKKNSTWGYLRDSVTHEPIVLASVTNLATSQTVMTSATGRFRIDLKENQVLSFAAVGYHFDTIHYTNQFLLADTLALFLSPLAHNLGNVTVTARGMSRYQLDSMERRKDFLQDIVNYTIPTVSKANSGAGIALNIDRFSRHERNKRKAHAFFESNEKEAYINYRFPAGLVTRFSGLKDDALQQFMQQYRPSAEWLREHTTEEDIKYYINDKLKLYFKR